ncbi:MAG TPA: ABC transporter substrate-binding protein, partial [Solirubrobacterales bacterium]|nr:ABC transporter substrate-binding protein [Solirubrobacterales bacterium]
MIYLIVVLAAALALAGCGEGSSAEPETANGPKEEMRDLRVTLDGLAGAPNVGIIIAEAYGYFDEAGLDVLYSDPVLPVRPLPYVVGGDTEVSVSHLPEVVLAQQEGAPVVAIGSVIPETTAAFIWLPESKIKGIADLEGKTIGVPGLRFQTRLLESLLAQAGLTLADVKVEVVDYELVPALTKGRVDATFGGSWSVEGAELQAMGLNPVITPVRDLGVPPFEELVL